MNRFDEIILELKEATGLDLYVDRNQACKLTFEEKISIQMQMDAMQETLFFVAPIDLLPPGNYRKRVILEALRSNSRTDVPGYLTFVQKKGELLLCEEMASDEIETEAIIALLEELKERAMAWKEAIETAQPCPPDDLRRSGGNTGNTPMFGLR